MPPTRHVFYTWVIKNELEEHQEHPNQMKSGRKRRGDCVHSNPFRVPPIQCPAPITSFLLETLRESLSKPVPITPTTRRTDEKHHSEDRSGNYVDKFLRTTSLPCDSPGVFRYLT